MLCMTPATERVVQTLGYAWIVGACASAFLGWGPVVGLIAGGIFAHTMRRT